MEHLRRMGKVIYLHLEYETMCRRIQNLDSRGVVLQAGYTLQDMVQGAAALVPPVCRCSD